MCLFFLSYCLFFSLVLLVLFCFMFSVHCFPFFFPRSVMCYLSSVKFQKNFSEELKAEGKVASKVLARQPLTQPRPAKGGRWRRGGVHCLSCLPLFLLHPKRASAGSCTRDGVSSTWKEIFHSLPISQSPWRVEIQTQTFLF